MLFLVLELLVKFLFAAQLIYAGTYVKSILNVEIFHNNPSLGFISNAIPCLRVASKILIRSSVNICRDLCYILDNLITHLVSKTENVF